MPRGSRLRLTGDTGRLPLYFQFGTPEEFERLLRIHLSRQIQEFAATNSSEQKAVSPIPALANSLGPETESEEEAESAELGLIDFLAISEFPKGRKYLISLSFRGKASVRPAQVGGFDVNIVIHGSTAVRGRGDLVAYRWALWKLTAPWTHRTRPPHLGKRCAFSTSSTGPFPSNHSRKTPKGPKIALGNPDRPDFLDSVDEHFHALNEIAGRIAKEITLLGENMRGRTQEVNAATADALQGQLGRREARGLIEKSAGDMTQFVAKMKTEIPLFKESLQKGATAAARAALINANLNSSNRTHADTVRNGLVKFRDALASAYEATKSFKGVVQGLPRMTAVLNKAKRDTAMVLQDLLDSMAEGRRIVTETIKSLDTRIG